MKINFLFFFLFKKKKKKKKKKNQFIEKLEFDY